MPLSHTSISNIAETFATARQTGNIIEKFPDHFPANLEEAYAIQDQALSQIPDTLIGWKVGGINSDWRNKLGTTRLVGPVFQANDFLYHGETIRMPVFEKGFAAIEGEVVAVLRADAPEKKQTYTIEDAVDLIAALYVGVEIASSPFPEINDHGPLVTISGFGNNFGLILGDEIPDWPSLAYDSWIFKTIINGETVGEAPAHGAPGGPAESVRYLLENSARRGLPLKAGMKILTGAVTGVHQAFVGDKSSVLLNDSHEISMELVPFSQQ
jgi:2-keto-4-pentenoate hydratase